MHSTRASRFRARHAVGERVDGTVIRYEQNGLAWVRIDPDLLLAALDTRPEPGVRMAFRILKLTPFILLKELHATNQGGAVLGDLIQGFRLLRDRFEADLPQDMLHGGLATEPRLSRCKALFETQLRQKEDSFKLYSDIQALLTHLNKGLRSMGDGEALYTPWIWPDATGHEGLLFRDENSDYIELEYGLVLPAFGAQRFSLFGRLDDMNYRVYLEHPEYGERLSTILDNVEGAMSGHRLQRLSLQPLRREHNEAVLNRLLVPEDILYSDFHRRV